MERRNDLITGLSPIDAYGLLGFIAGYRPAAFDEAASRYGRRPGSGAGMSASHDGHTDCQDECGGEWVEPLRDAEREADEDRHYMTVGR